MHLDLLGIRVDNLSGDEIEERAMDFLKSDNLNQIATINPEFILEAQKDKDFKEALNRADLNIADGIGIKFAFWRFGKNLKKRIAGVDLMWNLLRIANKKKLSVFLVANENGISSWQDTAEAIRKSYPDVKVRGINMGHYAFFFGSEIKNIIKDAKDCEILFCNFGAPYQDKFIAELKKHKSNIRIAIGVGGSFDFISGKIIRAPRWMRRIGLEWLWRLIIQPKRINRIFKAVIIFPIKIILNR
ncbi:MAG: WecB/TagA/CpsF family glycosyltransferase [Candidatus Moranbacteria bacterium]|jgi:N-acetylglucosaminyldiphosphoundecaprenol N-acetyl-beta-D-mannosaminyltransferase|nr:WecB/TagA/CpsF family glycosyltransferase [Candidatus Moranbacteria bacterium]MDD5652305.1 WecB/TagA/CpsF family glycosyltransferase [Candidatus Moranbacteria bacterium]MDX9855223.1 WecB/TagA/CpsF family glycosyltransferase [Candidatus Moranbacteria bacterium]